MPTKNELTATIHRTGLEGSSEAAVFAVVATLTVKEPLEALLKSIVYGFRMSPEFTEQVALGAIVVQEKYMRPFPAVEETETIDVPVCPSVTLMAGAVMVGPGIAEGV